MSQPEPSVRTQPAPTDELGAVDRINAHLDAAQGIVHTTAVSALNADESDPTQIFRALHGALFHIREAHAASKVLDEARQNRGGTVGVP